MKTESRKLVAAVIGSRRHIYLIMAGFVTHHTDGMVTYMELQRSKANSFSR